jgi:lipopolysaccharide heptosyltransferase I
VHALPVLCLLRRRYPEAHISWLVAPYCSGLLRGLPQLNDVIHFERKRLGSAWWNPRALIDLLRFHSNLRRREFDLVVDLQGLFRSGWMSWATRAPMRIGFRNARELAWLFYTHRVPIDTMEQHAVDRYLKVAAALGCDASAIEFPLLTTDADRQAIDALLPRNQRFAILMPGANWPTKRWPAQRFVALVEPLRNEFGLTSIVAGGDDAAAVAPSIRGAIDLTNRTTLPQLIALFERAGLVIANDSGPMHIAAAMGRPLVAIFGPTNPVRTGPYRRPDCVVRANLDCSPCYKRNCSHLTCIQRLDVSAVLNAIRRQLAPSPAH